MRTAIILHGKANKAKYFDQSLPSPSNAAWFPWLQKQLLMEGILAQTPEFPTPWQPNYDAWSNALERYEINMETMLVAHSCGAGFIVRWLSEHPDARVGNVVLVAPWIDPDRTGGTGEFFDFTIDPALAERSSQLIIFNSSNDFQGAQDSARIITDAIPGAKIRTFENYGHFMDMTEFAELRDELLQ